MLDKIENIVWLVATFMLLGSGIYFTIKLKFLQFDFKKMFSGFRSKTEKGISPLKTFLMALAGRIGVGSIAGVALAIYAGGIGSLFWMWLIAIISATNAFAETALGIKYKEKDENDVYKGGPSYYIKKGLGNYKLGAIYAIIMILSYTIGFVGIQANTMTKAITTSININPYLIGVVICITAGFIIFGGVKKIADATSKIVPIMTILYVGMALIIAIMNIKVIPNILVDIFKSAFNFKPFIGGFLGMAIIGIQRGIFSNEAGIGTGSIAASASNSDNPASQGYIQMLGVYITTFLICSATAIIILTSNYTSLNINDVNGIEIASYAFKYHFNDFGSIVLLISILLFAFSTVLSGYYYGESSLKYFFKKIKKEYILILKILTIVVLFLGSIISSTIMWNFVDLTVALLAIINVYAIFKLRKEVITFKNKK